MREYLFIGQRKDNGEWVEGFLLSHKGKYHICPKSYMCSEGTSAVHGDFYGFEGWFEVILETVGQYTGLTDMNGKTIFEGNVVKVTDDEGVISHCNCGVGKVCFLEGLWYIDGDVQNGLYDINRCYYIEVIGNTHDTEGGKE